MSFRDISAYYLNKEVDPPLPASTETRKGPHGSDPNHYPPSASSSHAAAPQVIHHVVQHPSNPYPYLTYPLIHPQMIVVAQQPTASTTSASSSSTPKSDTKKKDSEPERNLVGGAIVVGLAGLGVYKLGEGLVRLKRVLRDMAALTRFIRATDSSQEDLIRARQLRMALRPFAFNRKWSLCNETAMLAGVGCVALSLLVPAPAWFAPGLIVLAGGFLSGAMRCSMWSNEEPDRTRRLQLFQNGLDRDAALAKEEAVAEAANAAAASIEPGAAVNAPIVEMVAPSAPPLIVDDNDQNGDNVDSESGSDDDSQEGVRREILEQRPGANLIYGDTDSRIVSHRAMPYMQ